ncbi:MAG: PqqD family protein [Candidatus Roizmanbacteria bacterium]|nr:PqqD family protein [Candidatus Roizmanbacteria bacterium]
MALLQISKKLIIQKVDKELVCFDSDNAYLYSFNEVGEYIFKKMKLGWDTDKIVLALAKTYNVELKVLKRDVTKLIQDMKKAKLLVSTARAKK